MERGGYDIQHGLSCTVCTRTCYTLFMADFEYILISLVVAMTCEMVQAEATKSLSVLFRNVNKDKCEEQ